MTTQEALQHFKTQGINGLSIEDMDKVCLHWLENPSEYMDAIKEYILFCSFGNYDLIKQEEFAGHKYLTCRHIYHNEQTDKYYCLQFEEEMRMQERWDFEWYEVYPQERTIIEYHRKELVE